jgi:hypothetical protein
MKRKNSSDYTVERVYNFILNCGGIASGSVIAKTLHISESWAQQCAREAIRRYGDIEAVAGAGYRKKGIECSYYISASLFAPNEECVYSWEGPVFKRMSDYDRALEEFQIYEPPKGELERVVDLWKTVFPDRKFELEITLFDGNDNELDSITEEV